MAAGYKVYRQTLVTFPNGNYELPKKEMKKTAHSQYQQK